MIYTSYIYACLYENDKDSATKWGKIGKRMEQCREKRAKFRTQQ